MNATAHVEPEQSAFRSLMPFLILIGTALALCIIAVLVTYFYRQWEAKSKQMKYEKLKEEARSLAASLKEQTALAAKKDANKQVRFDDEKPRIKAKHKPSPKTNQKPTIKKFTRPVSDDSEEEEIPLHRKDNKETEKEDEEEILLEAAADLSKEEEESAIQAKKDDFVDEKSHVEDASTVENEVMVIPEENIQSALDTNESPEQEQEDELEPERAPHPDPPTEEMVIKEVTPEEILQSVEDIVNDGQGIE
jgi:hypothetical protein